MSTANFYCKNASSIFAFGMNKYSSYNEEDENGEYDQRLTDMDFEESIYYVQKELCSIGYSEENEDLYDRSYGGKFFAVKGHDFSLGAIQAEIIIHAGYRYGYFEGACFDWEAQLTVFTLETERYCGLRLEYDLITGDAVSEHDVVKDLWMGNKGLSMLHAKRLIERIYSEFDSLIGECEKVFGEFSEYKLRCIGRASNGEAFYEAISA